MSQTECNIYLIFAYLPFVTILISVHLLIIGVVSKYKKALVYKKCFFASGIFFAIFFLCLIAIIAMGLIGVGPGISDT
ncbi:hypothetical protein [Lacrimispora xylanisolvens]|uniref:hypothetical protein n=1 Tax=Lacrimispora xylanisolvens TaxID=384636 RepID=UPI0024027D7C